MSGTLHALADLTKRRRPTAAREAIAVLAWAPSAARSVALARALNARCYLVHKLAFQRPVLAPIKYPLQALESSYLLWRDRPTVVIVQNPPPLAVLCVAAYCRLASARYVIDSHSSALVDRKWAWSHAIQRWLGRHAVATLIHTPYLVSRLAGAGTVMLLEDPPPALPESPSDTVMHVRRVVVIGSLAADEPIEALLAAATMLPDVEIVLTGDPRHAAQPDLLKNLPSNVRLAGWLSFPDYLALLRSAAVISSLTTRDFTVLRGAWEAVYLAQPLVTSSWLTQRACFTSGTVFVDNNAQSIAAGMRKALEQAPILRHEMTCLANAKKAAWTDAFNAVQQAIAAPSRHTQRHA